MKTTNRVLKEKYGYDHLLDISIYTTVIHLKDYLDGIHDCVTFVRAWIFDKKIPFALPLTKYNLE